jgi:hypothetical protein
VKTIKISEATNTQLDWLVAKCEGATDLRIHIYGEHSFWVYTTPKDDDFPESMQYLSNVEYSTDWPIGGPIIERELLAPEPLLDTNCSLIKWRCRNWKGDGSDYYGPTPLIAAMRCFVASKLGETVEVPEELL